MGKSKFLMQVRNNVLKLFITILTLTFSVNFLKAQSFYSNYPYRVMLTANNTSLGTTTDQKNFPLLLKVVSPSLVASSSCATSASPSATVPNFAIISTLAGDAATELYYQVESYDSSTGTIYFWVNTPTVKAGNAGVNNTFYCYFGSPSPPISHTTTWQKNTWTNVTATAGVNYAGVWHFNEAPVAAISSSSQFLDATPNNNTLVQGATTSTTGNGLTQNTASQIGNGITLKNTSVLDVAATSLPNSNASQTLSIWASYPSLSTNSLNFIVAENSSNTAALGNALQLGVKSGTTLSEWYWGGTSLVTKNPAPAVNTWHHLAFTYNSTGNVSTLYVDGVLASTSTTVTPQAGTINMVAFGDYILNSGTTRTGGGEVYTGTMDESHVIATTLSADWIKAEYKNQSSPSTFTTVGSVQVDPTNSAAAPGALTYTWKGTNTDITNANNWDNTTSGIANQAPTGANVNWSIPAGLSFYPKLTASASVYGLTLASGAYIDLNGNTLNVGCNIYNSGIIKWSNLNASTINFNGSLASQLYSGTSTTGTGQLGNLTIANTNATGTITVTGNLDVYNQLTVTSGNLYVNNGATVPGVLTLKSSGSLTAGVTAIPTGFAITGNVNVERYITGGTGYRGYRLLSSPVNISSNSSGGGNIGLSYLNTTIGSNPAALTGGPGGSTNGFTVSNANPTLYLFNESNATNNTGFVSGRNIGVTAIAATTVTTRAASVYTSGVTIPVGNSYLFYFIGNNASTVVLPSRIPDNTTVTAIGYLNQGNIPVTIWNKTGAVLSFTASTGGSLTGFNQVGNPYASTISLDQVYTDNYNASTNAISPNFYELAEPGQNYASYNAVTKNASSTNVGKYVASGQGFIVTAMAANQTLTFKEDQKTNVQFGAATQPLILALKPTPAKVTAGLHLQLTKDSLYNSQTGIYFAGEWSDKYNFLEDAVDFNGLYTPLLLSSFSSDGERLSINAMSDYITGKRIRLFVKASTALQYNLKMTDIAHIDTIYNVFLVDKLLKDSVDLRKASYNFNINPADTTTFGGNRFELAVELKDLPPYKLLSFNGQKTNNAIQIAWKTINERYYTGFVLEKLVNDKFMAIDSLQSDGSTNYSFSDANVISGVNSYRLKQNDAAGHITYSDVVAVDPVAGGVLSVYPNPARDNIGINVNLASKAYNLSIYNSLGALIKQTSMSSGTWEGSIASYNPGAYVIEVYDKSGNFIGKTKFVKVQ